MFYTRQTSNADFQIHGDHVLDFLERNPEALANLAEYGFGTPQLQEGRMLFNHVQLLARQFQDQRRKQIVATDIFHQELTQVKQCYLVHLHAARRVLGRDAQHLLTPVPSRYTAWLEHIQSFYSALLNNPGYQAALRTVKIDVDDLVQVNALIARVIANKDAQVQAHNSARLTRQQRELKMKKSKRWFEVLMGIARVAFQEQPAWLATLRAAPVRTEAEKLATRQRIAERRAAKKASIQ